VRAGIEAGFAGHIASGVTTLCHCWQVTRRDGVVFASTDHDVALHFDGVTYRANAGLSAQALAQTSGLSVDNTEALGALCDDAIREDEIEQGRFDRAEVQAWLVNWAEPSQRVLQFRGSIGELRRAGGSFRAELRGLTEPLNRPLGRVYQKPCSAVLGDGKCRFDLSTSGYIAERVIEAAQEAQYFRWGAFLGFEEGWFARGRLDVLDGPAAGLWGMIKLDYFKGAERVVELWEPIRGPLPEGTAVRLTAGCDKRMETCRLKFNNLINFQGFPDLPNEDWMMAVPRSDGANGGGSRR